MVAEKPSSKPRFAARWGAARPSPARPYRLASRLIGIPAITVVGVLLYSGLRDHFVLPECDSGRAKQTLADVLKQLKFEPLRYDSIRTVSTGKDEVACNAVLPLPDGADVVVDYSFFWQGNKASMKYSISRRAPKKSGLNAPRAAGSG
jgi:hypothetical protein